MIRYISILVITTTFQYQQSFVDTAPTTDMERANYSDLKGDDSVKELENLKNSLGRTLSMMKTQTEHYSNENGKKEIQATDIEEVKQNGKLVAKLFQQMDTDPEAPDKGGQPPTRVRTEVEVPSEGIRKSVVQHLPADYPGLTENGNRKSTNSEPFRESRNIAENSNSISAETSQYTPLDMAEYVFWTGDEKSVSIAIEEFLQEGMMSREEAILFLQEIKYNLDYLKNHYNHDGTTPREQHSTIKQENYRMNRRTKEPRGKSVGDQIRSELNQLRLLQEAYNKRNGKRDTAGLYFTGSNHGKTSAVDGKTVTNEDYEELLERLRLADFLYTEYSLEEVIYQLAKAIFTQSLTGGSAEAQQALTKFINFLEMEAEKGHISRSLEKKVLDVLIASLTDTLGEHPELFNREYLRQGVPKTSGNAGQKSIRQFLELSPEDKEIIQGSINPLLDIHRKQVDDRNQLIDNSPNKEQNVDSHITYGLGK